MRQLPVAALVLVIAGTLCAHGAPTMTVEDYEPRSSLVVAEHRVTRARFPFIDVHSHHPRDLSAARVAELVGAMDALGLRVLVNLSGGSGAELVEGVRTLKGRHPERFIIFANLDFRGIDDPAWGTKAAAQLERDVKDGGAQGLKVFKELGLTVRTASGGRLRTDDPRLDPVWAKAGELGIPVLIHTGEPKPFFDPVDRHNERWLELQLHRDRARPASSYASWEATMREMWSVFRRHRGTTFIAAHLGWLGNDLGRLGALLDSLPNVYTELAAVGHELGRQPRAARRFLIAYQDRVMMGKDSFAPAEYHTYFRLLETDDEYFEWFRRYHGDWRLYGLDLPDEVLRKVYYRNALRVIPGIDRSAFPE